MFEPLTDLITGKAPMGVTRSKLWPATRDNHILIHPRCEVCNGKAKLSVHHIHPFHSHPELELEPTNLLTLCESRKHGIHCHLLVGHLGNFRKINPTVIADADVWRIKLTQP